MNRVSMKLILPKLVSGRLHRISNQGDQIMPTRPSAWYSVIVASCLIFGSLAVDAVAERHGLAWGTVRDVDLRILREKVKAQKHRGAK